MVCEIYKINSREIGWEMEKIIVVCEISIKMPMKWAKVVSPVRKCWVWVWVWVWV